VPAVTSGKLHPLTGPEAAAICYELHCCGIDVEATKDTNEVVHVWPEHPVSVAEEIAVLGAFLARTDSRIAWHQVAP
jgi:hypothetical protein